MSDFLVRSGLNEFIVFDVETTGLNPQQDALIEFAAVKFVDGQPAETLAFLCNPGYPIPPEIEQLTGIKDEMLKDKMPFEQHLDEVLDFIGESPLVGHNVAFDLGFLKEYLKTFKGRKKRYLNNPIYDTLLLAQAFLFFLLNHRLTTVVEFYGLTYSGAHRAERDALNTGLIFLKLIEEVQNYDLETIQTINMVLKDTDDPNKLLYKSAAEELLLKQSLGSGEPPQTGWIAPENIFGEAIDRKKINKAASLPIEKYFDATGPVASNLTDFETRPQQTEMAQLILECLQNEGSAIIEAGTGVGKSLAYLIPAVIWLNQQKKERKRVLIASNTKNLQEQIFYKEIPFVNEKLKLPFKAVLLKGRSNYICLTRWHRYLNALPQQLHVASRSAIIPIIIWLKHTHTGDISENNGFKLAMHRYIWNEICSEPGYCTTSVCQKYGGCFLGKARYDAFSSDVMIVNHSLLLADSAADNQILPEFNALIIDEAHNLEKNSYNYFAQRVNLPMLTYFLNGLYNGSIPERGLLVDITEIARQLKSLNKIEQHRLKIIEKIGDIKIAAEIFFRKIVSSKINKVSNSSKMFGIKRRYKDFSAEFPGFEIETSSLIYELSTCAALLTDLYNLMEEVCADYSDEYDEMRLRLINQKMMLEVYLETLRTVTTANNEALIFWYEIAANGKDNYVEIVCTPLNIATDIFEKVYGKVSSTVLTSATLQVAESFDYILTRSGLNLIEEHPVISRALGSPFFYNDQMAFYTYHQNEREVNEAFTTARLIKRLAGETGKGILVLFTSYSFLYEVYQLCLPAFMEMGITLLAQGQGASRTAILEQFRIEQNSVLFGTDSFWEGVDVIGSALEILVITKLPFPVPSEPIIEANVERLKNEDRDPFNEYYVPESVLKFRQGVGRLIRSINDVGVVINLDSRIDKKAYGRYFKKSLPVEPISIMGEDELLAVVRKFFRIGK